MDMAQKWYFVILNTFLDVKGINCGSRCFRCQNIAEFTELQWSLWGEKNKIKQDHLEFILNKFLGVRQRKTQANNMSYCVAFIIQERDSANSSGCSKMYLKAFNKHFFLNPRFLALKAV